MPRLSQPQYAEAPTSIREIAGWRTFNVWNMTPRAEAVLNLARREAELLQHNFIGTEHVLLGIISLGQGVAVNVLTKMRVDLEALRHEVKKRVLPPAETMPDQFLLLPRVKRVVKLAAKEAKALGHSYLGTEHLLLGLLAEGDGIAARALINVGVDLNTARQHVRSELDPNYPPI